MIVHLPAERVVRVLDQLKEWRGLPQRLRLDNGPEFIVRKLIQWADENHVALAHIQPGKPTQNAFMERFNRTYRHEILDAYVFESLADVRDLTTDFHLNYNTRRPHDSLGRVPPLTFLPRLTAVTLAP